MVKLIGEHDIAGFKEGGKDAQIAQVTAPKK
jgi:hypothetical protein